MVSFDGTLISIFNTCVLQIPTRVVYINGFKGIRNAIDQSDFMKTVGTSPYPNAYRLAAAIAPGLCMTPVSSMLEAYNAGHMNKEPLSTRWTRGIVPRCCREIIFGIGLNQLSDFCEERVDFISNKFLRNAAASICAGVIAGYLSHVPHNMSTLKILNPHKSYPQLFKEYISNAENRLPAGTPPSMKRGLSYVVGLLAPRGLLIRTSQIVGSFVILNGTINALQSQFNKSQPPEDSIFTDPRAEVCIEQIAKLRCFMYFVMQLLRRVRLQRAAEAASPPASSNFIAAAQRS